MAGAFVCRHREGVWNAVSADEFGEQTYIPYGKSKGGLVGMTLSAEQVACWVRSFHLCQHVSHTFGIMFDPCPDDDVTTGVTTKHKEEGIHRRELDTADCNLVTREFKTHAHPLTDQSSDLVNIVNRKVADKCINVVDAVSIGEETVHDMEAVYNNITTVLECAVPPSIIDEFGIPRKVKAQLMKNVVIVSTEHSNTDYVIVAAGQLLYHIVWPSDGTVSTIATSMGARLQPCNALPTTVVFDRYGNVSAKDHERERRAIGVCVPVLTASLSLHLFPTEKS